MRFAVLGSGSGGNSAVVECGSMRLMLDAGLSAKQLATRMQSIGVDPASLNGILLTHEHGDHIKGLEVFLRKYQVPVYATALTKKFLHDAGIKSGTWKIFEAGCEFQIGDAVVTSFAVQHDAVDPVGFVIGDGRKKIGLASDMGHVTRRVTDRLRQLDGLFVEANYDKDLLDADSRFLFLTVYAVRMSALAIGEMMRQVLADLPGKVECGELGVREEARGITLPTAIWARWSR